MIADSISIRKGNSLYDERRKPWLDGGFWFGFMEFRKERKKKER